MAKGSSKKPGDPKCRGCGGLLEGRPVVRIGGNKWHQECAEKQNKFIAREYRDPSLRKPKQSKEEKERANQPVTEDEEAAAAVDGAEGEGNAQEEAAAAAE
jgi:hypothetical protein